MHEWKHDRLELDADFSLFFRRKNVSKLHLDHLLSYNHYNIHWFEILLFQDEIWYLKMSPLPGPDSGLQ